MRSLPTGTVTFLFTDIQGSTRLWERDARRMQTALVRHNEILESTVEAHGGNGMATEEAEAYALETLEDRA
jgi:class 3 adenylate cyclase